MDIKRLIWVVVVCTCTYFVKGRSVKQKRNRLQQESGSQVSYLGSTMSIPQTGGWIHAKNGTNKRIMVNFTEPQIINGITTQGVDGQQRWNMSYYLMHSFDGVNFTYYQENGQRKIFSRHFEDSSVSTQSVEPFAAKYVRLVPDRWHAGIGLRLQMVGCNEPSTTTSTTTPLTTPSTPSTTPTVTSTTNAPTTKCVEIDVWSPWINRDKPLSGEGDREAMTGAELARFCPGELGYYIKKVECNSAIDNIPSYSTGDIMICDKNIGLTCLNSDNFPVKCKDYMIRYQCHHSCKVGKQHGSDQYVPVTDMFDNRTLSPKTDSYGKRLTDAYGHTQLFPTAIVPVPANQGTPTPSPATDEFGQPIMVTKTDSYGKTTTVDSGNTIMVPLPAPQGIPTPSITDEYGNPFMVPAEHTTIQISTQTDIFGRPVMKHCTYSHWTPWVNRNRPDLGFGDREVMTPDELDNICKGGSITKIECATVDGIPSYSSGEILSCTRLNGLTCQNADNYPVNCADYKIRYYCDCSGTAAAGTDVNRKTTIGSPGKTGGHYSLSSAAPKTPAIWAQCRTQWSAWINKNNPASGGTGDYEKMADAQKAQFCPGGTITKVECYAADGDIPYYSSGEISTCVPTDGYTCNNADNFPITCRDFKARFYCSCPENCQDPDTNITTIPYKAGPITLSQTTKSPTPPPLTTTLAPTQHKCVTRWSSWIDKDNPTSNGEEVEHWTNTEKIQFCPGGKVNKIECVTVDREISHVSSGEVLTCYPDSGLVCRNSDNFPVPCSNYKIRYFCQCIAGTDVNSKTTISITGKPSGHNLSTKATTKSPEIKAQCHTQWFVWINKNNSAFTESGPNEKLTDAGKVQTCPCGTITKVECVATDGNISYYSSEEISTCVPTDGYSCITDDDLPITCSDFNAIFYCPCQADRTEEDPKPLLPSWFPYLEWSLVIIVVLIALLATGCICLKCCKYCGCVKRDDDEDETKKRRRHRPNSTVRPSTLANVDF